MTCKVFYKAAWREGPPVSEHWYVLFFPCPGAHDATAAVWASGPRRLESVSGGSLSPKPNPFNPPDFLLV